MPLDFGVTGQTPERRREEADALLKLIGDSLQMMEPREAAFVESCGDPERQITPKMLGWLRDIKDKYL